MHVYTPHCSYIVLVRWCFLGTFFRHFITVCCTNHTLATRRVRADRRRILVCLLNAFDPFLQKLRKAIRHNLLLMDIDREYILYSKFRTLFRRISAFANFCSRCSMVAGVEFGASTASRSSSRFGGCFLMMLPSDSSSSTSKDSARAAAMFVFIYAFILYIVVLTISRFHRSILIGLLLLLIGGLWRNSRRRLRWSATHFYWPLSMLYICDEPPMVDIRDNIKRAWWRRARMRSCRRITEN